MNKAEFRKTQRKAMSAGINQLCDDEKCATCGSIIPFGVYLSRNTYQYKRQIKGKIRYYCKYSCMREDERRDPIDGRRTKSIQKAKAGS